MQKWFLFLLLFTITLCQTVSANVDQDTWRNYIDATLNKPTDYLFEQTRRQFFNSSTPHRAFDLGAGAGNESVELISLGWQVDALDISMRSGEVLKERTQYLPGQLHFQLSDFSNAQLSGNYDLIMSFYALPFGNRNDLPNLLKIISDHMQKGGVFAVNFFGKNHDYVKAGTAYGVTREELVTLLAIYHFHLRFLLNRIYDQHDYAGNNVHWDMLDVIAVKE